MSNRHAATRLFGVICIAAILGCQGAREPAPSSQAHQDRGARQHAQSKSMGESAMKMTLTSTAFKPGAAIPRKYTGEGDDISPPLAWADAPAGTTSFALICDDPDAPSPEPWVHWVIYGIPAETHALPEGVKSNEPALTSPTTAKQGKNSFGSGATIGFRGPMPPPGHGVHHYHFKLYALDTRLDLPPGSTKQQLLNAMKGHVLAEAELIGTYERKQ
ncbi:MAG TPA: YbhB/YbcL family Raf kinase inhibitor-like protein [Lacipirellulaceae bacterium]|nr:YbhB/YbcL family Raf kinase inhibitor-like protein [Lacipirellulaceae bacterium]